MFFFFFSSRRRHTRLQGDWSSDVCSSDLEDLGYRPWSSSHFWRTPALEERPDGRDAGRQRPVGLRPEEVPPPDHPSRTVPGHEAEALLRESERSTSAEGQGSGAPQGEVRSPPRTPLSQEYSRWHASPVS